MFRSSIFSRCENFRQFVNLVVIEVLVNLMKNTVNSKYLRRFFLNWISMWFDFYLRRKTRVAMRMEKQFHARWGFQWFCMKFHVMEKGEGDGSDGNVFENFKVLFVEQSNICLLYFVKSKCLEGFEVVVK